MSDTMQRLGAIAPLDGRYRADLAPLASYFSEAALFRYRVQVEIEYLIFLSRAQKVEFVPAFDPNQQAALRALYRQFSDDDALAIAAWDRKVNHDVKAVEYWLREQLDRLGMGAWKEAVHFALTSEDVNNLAYGLLVREARDQVLLPALAHILERLRELADAEAESAMLARTHGQAATPTTFGKELNVFFMRLRRANEAILEVRLTGKLNGATGTFAAQVAALPEVDWITFSRAFVRSLDLDPVLLTTQIEPHDSLATLCDALKRANSILLDLCQDLWRYISDGYLSQAPRPGEVGSSTMPHKVNPIDFENAEGNLGLAVALLEHFSRKLPISRLQRDLSDSTVLRNLGVAFGYTLLGYQRTLRGLGKIAVRSERLYAELVAHPEVLAEAVQTILRREGVAEPYELLKTLTRGRELSLELLHQFIEALDIATEVKAELRALSPTAYSGLAARLARLRDDRRLEAW
ncbi:adenylosuccinate lyase [Candidatus Viridilinea mediisalina]|uniref:Adenylosuccinate lyase n=1 Tax=Candidatus Viridilinea mediisalina TaxID=2024553 RepID=A0A2A6RJT6_9CHLR|nr:adenylosuccinate lyase [Candidatus Viridilinea mediisalina]PDW03213.1 adenylosuccinate lyase [Candidatus Viridilinea mediisalina]